ncbi:septum formation protein [Anaerosolibacter carboniphilus]|uniref:dTTP/UTP pyrophosphatase n=1 Tax=Anaerosolibacter carboniphilus TaxID=1417629 RepID=A0A841KNC1_9FIRM|nr:nucleoside triphosphate pyrophosphatase [Anaerosolibacter carboniphilus]MBB6214903.1 septum formation protein [Anaerosolibacter carboniphilus]
MSMLFLASGSPRRAEILKNFNIAFEIIPSTIEEKIYEGETPEQIVMALALEKANSIVSQCNEDDLIIAADTVVVKGSILGKPRNYDEAYSMLKHLENDVHEVITGLAVIQVGTLNKIVTFERTRVKFKPLSDVKIQRYIDSGEVWDKAGSYAIQGKGSAMIEWISGDYFNVVGLPINKLDDILSNHFDIELI